MFHRESRTAAEILRANFVTGLVAIGTCCLLSACLHTPTSSASIDEERRSNLLHRSPNGGNGSERGGGDVLFCPKGVFGKSYYLADTYDLFNSPQGKIFSEIERKIPERYLREVAVELLAIGMEESKRELFLSAVKALENLNFQEVDTIEEIDDDHLALPEGCEEKLQLAVQDIGKGSLRVHKRRFRSLKNIEREFLMAHEVFIGYYYRQGFNFFDPSQVVSDRSKLSLEETPIYDTTHIRNYLKQLASAPHFQLWVQGMKSFMTIGGVRFYDLLNRLKYGSLRKEAPGYLPPEIEDLTREEIKKLLQFKILSLANLKFTGQKVTATHWDVYLSGEIHELKSDASSARLFTAQVVCSRTMSGPRDITIIEQSAGKNFQTTDGGPNPVSLGHCHFKEIKDVSR